jgi:hypothetical protein
LKSFSLRIGKEITVAFCGRCRESLSAKAVFQVVRRCPKTTPDPCRFDLDNFDTDFFADPKPRMMEAVTEHWPKASSCSGRLPSAMPIQAISNMPPEARKSIAELRKGCD